MCTGYEPIPGKCPCLKKTNNPYAYWDVYENPEYIRDENLKGRKGSWTMDLGPFNYEDAKRQILLQNSEINLTSLLSEQVALEIAYEVYEINFDKLKQPAD